MVKGGGEKERFACANDPVVGAGLNEMDGGGGKLQRVVESIQWHWRPMTPGDNVNTGRLQCWMKMTTLDDSKGCLSVVLAY